MERDMMYGGYYQNMPGTFSYGNFGYQGMPGMMPVANNMMGMGNMTPIDANNMITNTNPLLELNNRVNDLEKRIKNLEKKINSLDNSDDNSMYMI